MTAATGSLHSIGTPPTTSSLRSHPPVFSHRQRKSANPFSALSACSSVPAQLLSVAISTRPWSNLCHWLCAIHPPPFLSLSVELATLDFALARIPPDTAFRSTTLLARPDFVIERTCQRPLRSETLPTYRDQHLGLIHPWIIRETW